MPPQRTPLRSTSGNSRKGPELTPYQRGQISGAKTAGSTPTEISREYELPYSTITSTLKVQDQRTEGASLPRPGRHVCYTPSEERKVLRHVRANPRQTYAELIEACGLSCHKNTVKAILRKHGIQNWIAKRRPYLTPAHAAQRLAWALKFKGRNAEEWGMIMWSDECSVEKGTGQRREWSFRTPSQKWHPEMVQTYSAGKTMKIMVWGCFWDTGRSNLYIMDRDFESKKHGYSANSYIEVLDAEVEPQHTNLEPGYEFMQDNASIHTAYKVRDWFADHGITQLMNWPPYSPDLNPIEHVWHELKCMVNEMFPELLTDKSKSEHARQRLESCLQAAWDCLPQSLFDNLYQSMPDRIEAVIQAKGWHTKY